MEIPKDSELKTRIALLNEIFQSGVNYNLFMDVIMQMRDDVGPNARLEKWNYFNTKG